MLVFILAGNQATYIQTICCASPLGSDSDLSSSFSCLAILVCCVSNACGQKSQISVQLLMPLIPSLALSCTCLAQEFKRCLFAELRDSPFSHSFISGVCSKLSGLVESLLLILLARKSLLEIFFYLCSHHCFSLCNQGHTAQKKSKRDSSLCNSLSQVLILLHHLSPVQSPQVAEIDMHMCCYVYVCAYVSLYISIYLYKV